MRNMNLEPVEVRSMVKRRMILLARRRNQVGRMSRWGGTMANGVSADCSEAQIQINQVNVGDSFLLHSSFGAKSDSSAGECAIAYKY